MLGTRTVSGPEDGLPSGGVRRQGARTFEDVAADLQISADRNPERRSSGNGRPSSPLGLANLNPGSGFNDAAAVSADLVPRLERAATVADSAEAQERGTVTVVWGEQNGHEPRLGRSYEGFDDTEEEWLKYHETCTNRGKRSQGGGASLSSTGAGNASHRPAWPRPVCILRSPDVITSAAIREHGRKALQKLEESAPCFGHHKSP